MQSSRSNDTSLCQKEGRLSIMQETRLQTQTVWHSYAFSLLIFLYSRNVNDNDTWLTEHRMPPEAKTFHSCRECVIESRFVVSSLCFVAILQRLSVHGFADFRFVFFFLCKLPPRWFEKINWPDLTWHSVCPSSGIWKTSEAIPSIPSTSDMVHEGPQRSFVTLAQRFKG